MRARTLLAYSLTTLGAIVAKPVAAQAPSEPPCGPWVVKSGPPPSIGDGWDKDDDTLTPGTYAYVHVSAGVEGNDTMEVIADAQSALESTAAQMAVTGQKYKSWHWNGQGTGRFKFKGRARFGEGEILLDMCQSEAGMHYFIDIFSPATPPIRVERAAKLSTSSGISGVIVTVPTPGGGQAPVLVPTGSAGSGLDHYTLPPGIVERLGEGCYTYFDYEINTLASGEVGAWPEVLKLCLGGEAFARVIDSEVYVEPTPLHCCHDKAPGAPVVTVGPN